MIANSPAAVAAEFSSSCRPVSDGDSRCAAIPEPITIAARNALPRNSAARRRGRAEGSVGHRAHLDGREIAQSRLSQWALMKLTEPGPACRGARRAGRPGAAARSPTRWPTGTRPRRSSRRCWRCRPTCSRIICRYWKTPAWSPGTAPRATGAVPTCGSIGATWTCSPARWPGRPAGCCSCAPRTPPARTWRRRCGGRRATSRPRQRERTRPRRSTPARSTAARRHDLPLPEARPQRVSDVWAVGDLVVTVCDLAHEELGQPGRRSTGRCRTRSGPATRPASTRP